MWRGDQHVGCAIYSIGNWAFFVWLRWAQCHRGLCDYIKRGALSRLSYLAPTVPHQKCFRNAGPNL